jgi:peptidoglycan hydrolase-like protein with peptidoglycan-binding domain
MWIWYVARSDGGNLSSIIATAHRHAVETVIIKSGDGSSYWSQFSSSLVANLHRGGLGVCAWQFVYGSHPLVEAEVAARAVRAGADCLLIDAEGEYQGRYAAAQTYMRELRSLVGASYPIGLASFPYVDYHPSFPYSVFLGPGGAQFNVPQMYWHDIGATVDAVYAHTYFYNAPYLRKIVPLGEVDGNPPPEAIKRFRQLRRIYQAPATSWWDWQSASPRSWSAISATVADAVGTTPQTGMPTLAYRTRGDMRQGDLVVWAQEHLWKAGNRVTIDGVFGTRTRAAVMSFQTTHRLAVTGRIDPTTWDALLHYSAANVTWTSSGARVGAAADAGHPTGLTMRPPASARLPAVAYEIPPGLGSG